MQNVISIKKQINPLSLGGCVLWLSANRNLGDTSSVRDWSGQNNHGTYNGSGGYPVYNRGFLFDGVNDYLQIPYSQSINFTQPFSISLWSNYDNTMSGNYNSLVLKVYDGSNNPQYRFGRNGATNFGSFTYKNSSGYVDVISTIAYWVNSWHYYVLNVFSNKIDFWRDSVLIESISHTLNMENTGNFDMYIGYNLQDGSYWNGSVDELLIYNRALSELEIRYLYERDKIRFGH